MLHLVYIYAAKHNELAKYISKYSVHIKTSPHLKKFISLEFGNPVKIDNSSLLGVVLISMLQKDSFHVSLKPRQKEQLSVNYSVSITCQAPMSLMKDYGHIITLDQVIQLNRFFEKFFFEKFFLFVHYRLDKNKRKMGVQDAIYDFCNYYDIDLEREISYDALKKAEYRHRNKSNNIIRAFVPKSSKNHPV